MTAAAEAYRQNPTTSELLSAAKETAKQQTVSGSSWYTVRPGDSLSMIAGRVYKDPAAWPVLFWANRSQVRWANDITVGQRLRIPAKPDRIPSAPKQLQPLEVHTAYTPRHSTPAAAPETSTTLTSYSGTYPGGAFGECVVERESGGNPQVMNASGHYGLYQFSASTWAEYGGNPADFGDASVAEQNQVFDNAIAAGGQSNWAPYDGC